MNTYLFTATGKGGTFNDHQWYVVAADVADAIYEFNNQELYDEDCVEIHEVMKCPQPNETQPGMVAWQGVKRWEGQELVRAIHDADIMVTEAEEQAQQERENDANYY